MKTPLFFLLASSFIWIGCLLAISFMESWLKFKAPGITLGLGLGIGRLIFNALNKMEWAFALISIAVLLFSNIKYGSTTWVFLLVPIFLLLLQTIWMLPALDLRAEKVIAGAHLAPSKLHWYFVGAEMIKLVCLSRFAYLIFKLTA